MTALAPSLKELARACLERHRSVRSPSRTDERGPTGETPSPAAWNAEHYRAHYHERAAIAAYDGGQERPAAEQTALEGCVVEWLNRNPPVQADPHRCPHCGQPEGMGRALLPVLTGNGGHVWVHDLCHRGWMGRRRAEAVQALVRMEIGRPPMSDG